jgi:hypothetical protein
VFREDAKDYGGHAWGEKGDRAIGAYDGYQPLVAEVMRFFRTGVTPVPAEETIELFAFMAAAEESKRLGGETVQVSDVLQRATANR